MYLILPDNQVPRRENWEHFRNTNIFLNGMEKHMTNKYFTQPTYRDKILNINSDKKKSNNVL